MLYNMILVMEQKMVFEVVLPGEGGLALATFEGLVPCMTLVVAQ